MIRVAVLVETLLYRQGLCQLLRSDSRFEVSGGFGTDGAAIGAVGLVQPDVILLDGGVPEGPSYCRALKVASPGSGIVLLAVGGDLDRVVRWAEAGVGAFVAKDDPIDELAAAIGVAARGDFVCPRRLVGQLVGHLAVSSPQAPHRSLTTREVQIVCLLERSLSNKEIASHLGIEVATAKNHVHNILEKLQVRRRSEAAAVLRRCTNGDSVGAAFAGRM
ncbi:MAG: response regulator transcription factor [Gemmatimonadota bacterium]